MAAPTYRQHPNCQHATLVEDFIVTARATLMPFIRVRFDGYSKLNDVNDYPLVYVAPHFTLAPLLGPRNGAAGQGVTVFSPTDSPTSYQLYSVDFEYPAGLIGPAAFPADGTLVTFPTPVPDTLSVQYFAPDFYLIMMRSAADDATDGATLVVSGDVRTLYTRKKIISYCPSDGSYEVKTGKFSVESSGLVKVLTSGGFSVDSTGDFILKSNAIQLKAIVAKLFEYVGDIYTTLGSGGLVVAAAPGAAIDPTAAAKATAASGWKAANADVFFQG